MRESRAYLNFFKRYILLFLILPLICGFSIYIKTISEKEVFSLSRLFELQHTQENAVATTLIADEIVVLLRSENLQRELEIPTNIEVVVLKPGPVSVNLILKGYELKDLKRVNSKLTDYLRQKYSFILVGNDVGDSEKTSIGLKLLLGFGTGILLAAFISLGKEYFKNY